MSIAIATACCAAYGPAVSAEGPVASGGGDRPVIAALISAYQKALNSSDAAASVALYAPDGVVMTPGRPTMVGAAALHQAYAAGAQAISLDVRFAIAEIEQVAADWAFVRTASSGTSTLKATGTVRTEANQELFVLHKDGAGAWRIREYGFSSTRPAP